MNFLRAFNSKIQDKLKIIRPFQIYIIEDVVVTNVTVKYSRAEMPRESYDKELFREL